jgi:transposase
MPWTQTDVVSERQKFVKLVLKGQVTMTQACQQFGISRKTGYKIMARHAELGMAGLADGSRAPKTSSHQSCRRCGLMLPSLVEAAMQA